MGGCSASGRAVDGVVLPVAPTSAARPGDFHYLAYSAIANVLDLPAVAFSVAREGYSDAKAVASPFNLSKMDEVVKGTCKLLDHKTVVHLPKLTLIWQTARMTRRICQSACR